MERMLRMVAEIRARLQRRTDELMGTHGKGDPYCDGLSMLFNKATLALEQLDHYRMFWEKERPDLTDDEIRIRKDQNAERVVEVTKFWFIGSLSALEFQAKRLVKISSSKGLQETVGRGERLKELFRPAYDALDAEARKALRPLKDRIDDLPPVDSFMRIFEVSARIGLIPAADLEVWQGFLDLRNCIVHNNAIAHEDRLIKVGGREVLMKRGETARGKMDAFATFNDALVDLFDRWATSVPRT